MAAVILGICVRLLPARIVSPFCMVGRHVGAVADTKQQGAVRSVGIFMHLTGRMHHECTRHNVDRPRRRTHLAAAFETEIDFRGVGMAMIGADLAGFPAGHRHIPSTDAAENLFDMMRGIPFLLLRKIENVYAYAPVTLSHSFVTKRTTRPRKT